MPELKIDQTVLNKQEQNWILDQRITRLSDNKEVLIYPMGAERFLFSALSGKQNHHYSLKAHIDNKDILIIPGYGNSCFLFAEAGAKSVTVYDKDPITIAWIKAFKKYYHYREFNDSEAPYPSVGELLTALTSWYPPLLKLPTGRFTNPLFWTLHPKSLRRSYIYYMLALVQRAIQQKSTEDFEYKKDIQFYAGELKHLLAKNENPVFDTVFVPYLLGVTNGIEKTKDIVNFIRQLITLVPTGVVLVTPSQNTKEFYIAGQSYFITTKYPSLSAIPELKASVLDEDKYWFKTQGLTVFGKAD
jgi:hypothetical protein